MIRNETRESAHLKSRVKDLSVVPNIVSFTPLLAAITPIAKLEKNADKLYSPILIRDTESLIANFGDPRIDPKKYIDLYSIMQVVGNGTSCYVAKVNSGESGIYEFTFLADQVRRDDTTGNETEIQLENEPIGSRKWVIKDVNNKYIVDKLRGYGETPTPGVGSLVLYSEPFSVAGTDDVEPSSPDSNPYPSDGVDLTGKYTWKCVAKANGKFDLEITLLEDFGFTNIVAFGYVDPTWGAEPIKVKAVTESENSTTIKYDESVEKEVSFTLKSTTKLENEYILLNSALNDLKTAFTIEATPDPRVPKKIDYKFSGGYLEITVTHELAADETKETLKSTLDGKLTESGALKVFNINGVTRASHSLIAYSSMAEDLTFDVYLSQTKPYSLHVYYLNVAVKNNGGKNILGSAKIKLEQTTTNQSVVNNLNSSLGTAVRFELIDKDTAGACPVKDRGANSIVNALLERYCLDGGNWAAPLKNPVELEQPVTVSEPLFKVSMNDYIAALEQYKAKKYVGCLMADLTAPVSRDMEYEDRAGSDKGVYAPNHEERRALHYNLKQIACERKDCTVVLSTPFCKSIADTTPFEVDDACDWVTSQKDYADLWEYGTSNTVDYSIQSFYLEIYYSWLKQQCTQIESGLAKSVKVLTAPANLVINNIMTSYRERGVHYPVAGDQYGTLPETCEIVKNPKTKAQRDQLVQCRINPIYDTGTRGIQIFGNETLNAGYTDLNAAHIARTLVYIRSTIDEYTDKLKFSINSVVLWDTWKNYVTNYILEPLKAANALREYDVKMGTDTTSDEEIANRMIKGNISLIFYQSAEIFDLTYTIYSTATTLAEKGVV